MAEYDFLAEIYDLWSEADPAYWPTFNFYSNLAKNIEGNCVEIGAGTGRIAIEVARRKRIQCVDCSPKMLEKLEAKARKAGVYDNISIQIASADNFVCDKPPNLIYFAFRSFGHLLTYDEKLRALYHINEMLNTGGCFVFDHYIFNESWAKRYDRVQRLMCKKRDIKGGTLFIYDTYIYDFDNRLMDCTITVEKTDADNNVIRVNKIPMQFSWIEPENIRILLAEAGFHDVKLYGGFNCEKFDENSQNQIWIVTKT